MKDEDRPDAGREAPSGAAGRRAVLLGGAAGSAVFTIRPAFAQAGGSILACDIPVPDPARRGSWIDGDGALVPPNTEGAFPPPGRPIRGEDVRAALAGRSLPGLSYEQSRAYMQYIRRLQPGTSGFTCFASLQMPRG